MMEWITAKLAGSAFKILVVMAALLMPVCAAGWAWEGVALHGIHIPVLWWHINLVDGAIGARDRALADRDAAVAARTKAEHDRDTWKGNADRLDAGLSRCNKGVDNLAVAGKALHDAAQAMVDQRKRDAEQFDRAIAGMKSIPSSGELCPVGRSILERAFQ